MTCSQQSSLDLEVDLPLIDLSRVVQREAPHKTHNHEVATKVRYACQEWGFFRVVNHGIPESLLQDVESAARQLCAMPEDVRQKAMGDSKQSHPSRPGREVFRLPESRHFDLILQVAREIWPEDGNPFLCKTIRTSMLLFEDLARTITKIILASLDLDVEKYYESDFLTCTSVLHVNHYISDRKSVDENALNAHTDIGVLTILHQDNKGGLQIRSKEGRWLNVKPLPHSFVVNVGDCLKVWSNGRYRSVEHRVVYNGWADRISVGCFIRFPSDKEISAPPELVDDQHPRRYRPFTFSQLKPHFLESRRCKQGRATFIDRYAAI